MIPAIGIESSIWFPKKWHGMVSQRKEKENFVTMESSILSFSLSKVIKTSPGLHNRDLGHPARYAKARMPVQH